MKVLILHPDFKDPGGVSYYYGVLKNKFQIVTRNFEIGKRVGERWFLSKIFRLVNDYICFMKELKYTDYDIVHINPSLNFKSVARDGIFILLAKYKRKKIIVFFRDWHKQFEKIIERTSLWIFKKIYGKADAFIVLAKQFRDKLHNWDFKQPIYLETTVVDDNLLYNFDIYKMINIRKNSVKYRILFLAQVIKEKGIYETINTIKIVQEKYPNIELAVAGDGAELQDVKNYVKTHKVPNVIFTGFVKGDNKTRLFVSAYVYFFPTHYGEGMPNSVLEAMAFGLPVITRSAGGIPDFFQNEKNGFITHRNSPSLFAEYLNILLNNKDLYERISLNNYMYAREHFFASKVVKRLEKIYRDVSIG